ncbi:MAG: 2-C-methyl-D-erythritol 2,4-cyclodiphosphate synthase [Fimbriimonadaceae bacterium]|nr:2-C-methyl-D-erythritol 2,4-cyclodiphosphate synthase [Fimbriimonadaceae bacterium]
MSSFALVIVAGGSSVRFGADKLWMKLPDGRPLWRASIDTLGAMPVWNQKILVVPNGKSAEFLSLLSKDWRVVVGGSNRLESVRAGVEAVPEEVQYVAVHDAARPFVSVELASRVIEAVHSCAGAYPSVSVTDTVHWEQSGNTATPPRAELWAAQTPQVVDRALWLRAADEVADATDDVGLLASAGHRITRVEGDPMNKKITTPSDLNDLQWETRTGWGYDIHQFSTDPARPMWLGGIEFDDRPGLDGHSDADVLLHAAVDALLGAAGMGDIGHHYPPTESEWKNCSSRRFLVETGHRLRSSGWSIVNLDLTVVGERPRIHPRRGEVVAAIAADLALPVMRVNLKATTNERLGALGRGEGLAAMAVATITRPVSNSIHLPSP